MAENASKDVTPAPARRVGLLTFFQEVRKETLKVTWPSFKETYLTTMMVFIMVGIAMLFFATVDSSLGLGLNLVLGVG